MTVRIELDEQTGQKLKAMAEARGMSVEAYLRHVAEDIAPPTPERLSNEEFERVLDEASEGLDNVPPLPADFSRADIHCDHD